MFFFHYFAVSDEVDLNSIADAVNVLAESILAHAREEKKNKKKRSLQRSFALNRRNLNAFCSLRFSEIDNGTGNPLPSHLFLFFFSEKSRDKETKGRFARRRDEETAVL